ncbi:MAG: T9SS type A sorting domain-containing protein [Bacteroidales bacterium]|nr:T9SS type A sorting domain-containing protein [Bacteroidales bacterium]
MKRVLLIPVLMLHLAVHSQSALDTIYAVVTGNQVTIHQDNAYQNCCFVPALQSVYLENDSTLSWYQMDTTYIWCGCMCFFDYSISLDSLPAGEYTAHVYSGHIHPVWPDTTYQGMTRFRVEVWLESDHIRQLTSQASDCHPYTTGTREQEAEPVYRWYLPDHTRLILYSEKGVGGTEVSMVSLMGRQLIEPQPFDKLMELDISSLPRGVYIIIIREGGGKMKYLKVQF